MYRTFAQLKKNVIIKINMIKTYNSFLFLNINVFMHMPKYATVKIFADIINFLKFLKLIYVIF